MTLVQLQILNKILQSKDISIIKKNNLTSEYFNEYTDKPRMMTTIKINVNDLKTEKEVLQWYVDMNAGGTPHSNEEINRVRSMIDAL